MNRVSYKCFLLMVLLALAGQSASAESLSNRTDKPVSLMVEASLGGPTGTIGVGLNYDFNKWAGVGIGGGFSVFSGGLMASAKLDVRLLTLQNAGDENAVQMSFGTSFMGPSRTSDEECDNGWYCEVRTYTTTSADYTVFLFGTAGWSYAGKSGLRAQAYIGFDLPVYTENYVMEVARVGTGTDSSYTSMSNSKPGFSLGVSVGSAF